MNKTTALLVAGTIAGMSAPAMAQSTDGQFTGFRAGVTAGYDAVQAGSSVDIDNEPNNNDQSIDGAVYGVQAGYDFDLGDHVFLGGELSGEKILAEDTYVEFALTGRLGTSVSGKGSVFLAGGYTFTHHGDGPHLGLGYEHHLGHGGTYVATEYRHVFVDHHEANAVTIGIGTFF